MKNLLYAILIGLFVVSCADLDYVDDYSDSTFYDEGEYVEVGDDDEYAQEVADEEVVEIAKTLNQKEEVAKAATSSESSETNESSADDEEVIEEVIEDEIIEEVASGESSDEEIIEAEQTAPEPKNAPKSEPKEVAQPQPTQSLPQPKQISQPTKPAQTTQITPSSRPIVAQSKPKVIYGRGLKGFFQSTAKLKSQCESKGNIRKCEDLARIYALKDNRDLALTYYDKACDSGNGSPLSCFFASRIYENSGDNMSAQRYFDALNGVEVKVKSLELNLSTLKVAKAKRNLKMSCTEGNESACRTLQSILKMRGEKSEMRTYFGTECWRGSALGCEILRSM